MFPCPNEVGEGRQLAIGPLARADARNPHFSWFLLILRRGGALAAAVAKFIFVASF